MMTPTLTQTFVMAILQIVTVVIFIFIMVPLTTFAERKVLGYLQQRLGATRVASSLNGLTGKLNRGMWDLGKVPFLSYFRGIPMVAADIIKLLLKEDIVPAKADKAVFIVAPAISIAASTMVVGIISFYPDAFFVFPSWFPILHGLPFTGYLTDTSVGLLLILGVAGVGVYGIVLGGWASNSKYPLLGGLRSAAQIVSYEVPLTFSLMMPVVLTGSLNIRILTRCLAGLPVTDPMGHVTTMPFIAAIPLLMGFCIYLTCGFAECNRIPFDMPEAENELVAGFHTEYTGMKFAMFYLAEYVNMIVVASLASAFFLGGPYLLPFGLQRFIPETWFLIGKPNLIFMIAKIIFILFTFIWVRGTIPRYRYDQVMAVAWKFLIPVTLIVLATAAAVRFVA
jgi:NADH-quinone oxidoreductase subunit H